MRITDTHVYFWGGIFSQWAKSYFREGEVLFSSAEQYMMYHKAQLFDSSVSPMILAEENPKIVKALGRKVKGFDLKIWNENKEPIIKNGNLLKFAQNKELREELLKHKGKIFVEASPVDCIYGVGLHWQDDLILNEKNWKGDNLLGKCLTQVCNDLYYINNCHK